MEYCYEVNELNEKEEILYSTTVKTYDEAITIYREWEADGGLVQLIRIDEKVDISTETEELLSNF